MSGTPSFPLKSLLLPLTALAGSAFLLFSQHSREETVRRETALFRETVAAVASHQEAARGKAEKTPEGSKRAGDVKERPKVDLKELAAKMSGIRRGTMPDMKTMLQLKKTMLELSPEEIAGMITGTGQLDLPAEDREGLLGMLLEGLAERDPKAAVMAASEQMQGSARSPYSPIQWTMREAFESWAKEDVTAALAWLDETSAAGTFETTELTNDDNHLTAMLRGALQPLWEKDPAAAKARLTALSEQERTEVLSGVEGFEENPARQKEFAALTRELVPAEDQARVLSQLAQGVYQNDDLEGVSGLLKAIDATPEERTALVEAVSTSRLTNWIMGDDEKPNFENMTKLRTWLANEDAAGAETVLGRSMAAGNLLPDPNNRTDTLALVNELHTAQPSDDLLIAFLAQALPQGSKEPWMGLADKIKDPAARAKALEKFTEP